MFCYRKKCFNRMVLNDYRRQIISRRRRTMVSSERLWPHPLKPPGFPRRGCLPVQMIGELLRRWPVVWFAADRRPSPSGICRPRKIWENMGTIPVLSSAKALSFLTSQQLRVFLQPLILVEARSRLTAFPAVLFTIMPFILGIRGTQSRRPG